MISIETSFISTAKMTDRSDASACSLGFSASFNGTGVSGSSAALPVIGLGGIALGGLPVRDRNERPTKALAADVAAVKAQAYAFAATSAETKKQTQHHTTWAFRGLEPWSDPA
ncbi:hypothetical protein [Streptomyces sp. NPDC096193]|uniref:hypothetical protein n=1 Tax=Streptomyces sp. NPDC096193 TaxID=3155821 RepID=UPI00331926DF